MKKIIITFAMTAIMISGYTGNFFEMYANNKVETTTNETATIETSNNTTTFETSQGTVELENRSILSDKIDIILPVEFGEMSEEVIQTKYPAGDYPTLVYTNDECNVNVVFNHTDNECEEEDIEEYFNVLKENIQNTSRIEEWYSDGVENQNGMKIAKMEFISPAVDTDIYNLMYLVSLDDRLLICSFNSTVELKDEWMPIAEKIMGSITKK